MSDSGRDRGAAAEALQPGEGPLSRGGLHQGSGHRLLHADRPGPAPPDPGPAAHAQALSQRGRRPSTSTRSSAPRTGPPWVQVGPGVERPQRPDDQLLPGGGPPDPHLGGQPGLARAPHRPPPGGRARRAPRTRRGRRTWSSSTSTPASRPPSPSAPRWVSGCGSRSTGSAWPPVPKTSGSKGLQVYVPLNTPVDLRRDEELRPGHGPDRRAGPPQAGGVEHGQGAAEGQGADRLEPERRAQDDGVGLLAAGPAPARRSPLPCTGRRSRRRPAAGRCPGSRPTRPSGASRPTATCSPRSWSWNNGCRRLVERSAGSWFQLRTRG